MTTIAVRGDTMASDSCFSNGDTGEIFASQSKLTKTKHGLILGGAGDCSDRDFLRLIEQVRTSGDLPTLRDLNAMFQPDQTFEFLMLFPNREIWLFEKCEAGSSELLRLESFYAAIGTGSFAARTAMRLGCSAIKAVEIACEVDVFSRPPVTFFTLDRLKIGKKRRK